MIILNNGIKFSFKQFTNILFISLDDLNDWIEPLGGHSQAITPNLQRLADQSVLFTNAYCASPACNPSRTAVMSGLAPHTSGVYSNYQDWRVDTTCWDEYWPSQTKNKTL